MTELWRLRGLVRSPHLSLTCVETRRGDAGQGCFPLVPMCCICRERERGANNCQRDITCKLPFCSTGTHKHTHTQASVQTHTFPHLSPQLCSQCAVDRPPSVMLENCVCVDEIKNYPSYSRSTMKACILQSKTYQTNIMCTCSLQNAPPSSNILYSRPF